MIRKVLQDPINVAENIYKMDEAGVMLSMPGSVKVLIGKNDVQDYTALHAPSPTTLAGVLATNNIFGRHLADKLWMIGGNPGVGPACEDGSKEEERH